MSTAKPITDVALLSEALDVQPHLFDFSAEDVGAVAEARAWAAHTGTTAIRDSKRVAKVVACWLHAGSVRKVADLTGMSRNTISAVLLLLEQAGKLEPLKVMYARRVRELGMETVVAADDLVTSGQRDLAAAAMLKSYGLVLKLVSDMDAAAGPALGSGNVFNAPVTIVQGADDPAEVYARMLRSAGSAGRTVDVESEVIPSNPTPIEHCALPDTAPDTSSTPSATPPPPSSPTDRQAATDPDQGAGGVANPPPPSGMDGTP